MKTGAQSEEEPASREETTHSLSTRQTTLQDRPEPRQRWVSAGQDHALSLTA